MCSSMQCTCTMTAMYQYTLWSSLFLLFNAILRCRRYLCTGKRLMTAVLKYLAVWRHQVVGETKPEVTNLWKVFSSKKQFDDYLEHGTRDTSFHDRGCFPKMMITWALQHQCLDHPGCGNKAWVLDGNFAAIRPKTQVTRPFHQHMNAAPTLQCHPFL